MVHHEVMFILIGVLFIIIISIIHWKPLENDPWFSEGFSGAASVDPLLMPECVSRSTDAQSLLSRCAVNGNDTDDNGNNLRLLVTKLCCMEADIASPSPGTYRTFNLQFRTSDDIEPPATLVGRCLQNAMNSRDIELILEKFSTRGHDLIRRMNLPSSADTELDNVITRLKFAMTTYCFKEQPHMDRPIGARDMGFWEPDTVADLSQYQGVSASPK